MPVAVALWAGLVLGAHAGTAAIVACLVLACALAWLADRAPTRTGAALVALVALAIGVARGGARARRVAHERDALPADGALVRAVVVLAEPARRETGVPQALARVLAASPPLPRGACVRLRLPENAVADWGDTLRVLARLERFETRRNPGGFDARAAADAAGALAHGRAFTARVSPDRAIASLPRRAALRLRRAMEAALARTLSARAHELAAPLLFGDRSAMTPETDARLRGSGLVHLLALSGLHVVWLAAVARGAMAMARGGPRARAWAGAACAGAYALLAGPLPSLMRAVAGEGIATLARLAQRALDPVQSLALGALVLLAIAPGWAHDLGFQLSCAATLGLVTLTAPLASPFAPRAITRALVAARVPRRVRDAIAATSAAGAAPLVATLAAQLGALPVLLARFHALPWTGLAANLAAVPVAELLLAGAWLGGEADALLPGTGTWALHACEPLAWALDAIAALASRPHLALLPCGHDPAPVVLAAAGALLLALALPAPRASHARARPRGAVRAGVAWLGAASVACALVACLAARPLAPPPGRAWLVAIDVGQGDAFALAFADGWWLVDAGPRTAQWDAGEGAVLPFLRWAGVRRLERLVLTHDDGDHTGGAAAVGRSLRVVRTLAPAPRPGVPGPWRRFGADTLARGDVVHVVPRVRVAWPPHAGEHDADVAARGDNAASLVLELGEGRARVLLAADADSVTEARLAIAPHVAVLKAAHHGSGSSSGAGFVARLAPERVLLSVGRHNAYGHPNAGALARLAITGAAFDRTDRTGAVWYELSETRGVRLVDWRAGDPPLVPPVRVPAMRPGR